VRAVAFSPDGLLLASGDGEERLPHDQRPAEVRVWDLAEGRQRHRLLGHPALVVAVAFSPDGRELVSVSRDGTVKVWGTTSGEELRGGKAPGQGGALSAALSPDGRLLACGGDDGRARLWDLAALREVRVLAGHVGRNIGALAFSPDGLRLVSASDDDVKVWDVTTGQELYALTGSDGTSLAFGPDGWRLVACGRMWDARPLTPVLEVEREALGLLDELFSRPLPHAEVVEMVRGHAGINEAVRRQALLLSARYQEETFAPRYAEAARLLALRASLPAACYRQALSQAEMACSLAPENGLYLTNLGMAQYRLGNYQEALRTLTRAERLNTETSGDALPAELALLALTHQELGQPDEARAGLARLRERMKNRRFSQDEEAQRLLLEAELRIDGKASP
jgi:hypothetical protein